MEEYKILERSVNGGVQKLYKFENSFEASVVQHYFSYGNESDKWELAVIKFDGDDWGLTYDTPITNDVIGHLSIEDVDDFLNDIKEL